MHRFAISINIFSDDSDEFKKGVSDLAKLLEVTEHPDHLVTLRVRIVFGESHVYIH